MGQFWRGFPEFFLIKIKKTLGDGVVAIEFGTYKAYESRRLAFFVDRLTTVEPNFNYYTKSTKKLQRLKLLRLCGEIPER